MTAISPMAHDALLHTETNSGASCSQSTGRYCASPGRRVPMQFLARSPTSA